MRFIVNISCPSVTSIGSNAFDNAQGLKSVYFPLVETIGQRAFAGTAITDADFLSTSAVGRYAFQGCPLTNVSIPLVASLGTAAFAGCTSLTEIDLPLITTLDDQIFTGCSALETVILRSENVCALKFPSAFNGTPFALGGTGGRALVRSDLIEDYKVATNWTALYEAGTCTFLPLEEYTVGGTTIGEIDWDKLNAA